MKRELKENPRRYFDFLDEESHEERIERERCLSSTLIDAQLWNLMKRELKVEVALSPVDRQIRQESHEERIESEALHELPRRLPARHDESHEERIESR